MTPDEAQKQRELDEAATTICDTFPPLWWTLFQNCMNEGFTRIVGVSRLNRLTSTIATIAVC